MKQVVLEKYHCMGNDYLVFDPNKNDLELNVENIKKMCSRHFGIGADGILAGPYLGENDFYVHIYNADGSEAEKSGNGMGIFAKYLRDAGYVQKTTISWKTLGGEETVFYLNEDATRVKISMGHPTFWSDEIPVTGERREMVNQTMVFGKIPYVTTCLSMGNPHCVIWMNEISKEMVCRIGEHSETSEYFPEKVNTQILNVLDRTNIQIEIYERGVGYTLASGSCACAAASAAYRLGLADPHMYVHMPGGTLEVEIKEDGMVYMVGEVGYVGHIQLGNELSEQLRIK
ncbi:MULTISPECIES: diaminopimelate epimerase [Clostridium]|jgi:diaminopimelate epimerase|uniref:Diaminopimelate epimerase n=1 Tax=Clostridium fessum TaxID=2126740 RepID=A0A2T3FP43_9CLOT|nr:MULTISPECIES: diaminopimelate epimerase [Clostridium]PST37058.1 diaminopimelate epimerase [Clostridium fessum]RHO10361.1 diaminopimelate epimerase [Clostridium sp. AM18-55]